MAEHVRADLVAPLEGKHVIVDADAVTMGFLEDLTTQAKNPAVLLDTVSSVLVGGDLPHGCDRAGLRKLRPDDFAAVLKGVTSAITDVPKAS